MVKVCPYCGTHVDCSKLPRRGDGRVTCPQCQNKFTPEVEQDAVDADPLDDSARNQGGASDEETPEDEEDAPQAGQESTEEQLRREARNRQRRERRAAAKAGDQQASN